jgi:hypothetical protein
MKTDDEYRRTYWNQYYGSVILIDSREEEHRDILQPIRDTLQEVDTPICFRASLQNVRSHMRKHLGTSASVYQAKEWIKETVSDECKQLGWYGVSIWGQKEMKADYPSSDKRCLSGNETIFEMLLHPTKWWKHPN